MKLYETTFIVNPQSDDATIEQNVTAITKLITSNGGTILRENRMGTRRLAYEVKKLTQGYYTNLIYEAPREVLPIIDRHFKLEDAYIRYLTTIYEGKVPSEEDQEEAQKAMEERADAPVPEVKEMAEPAPEETEEAEEAEEAGEAEKTDEEARADEPIESLPDEEVKPTEEVKTEEPEKAEAEVPGVEEPAPKEPVDESGAEEKPDEEKKRPPQEDEML